MEKNKSEKGTLTILWLDDATSFAQFRAINSALTTIEFDLGFTVETIFEKDLVPGEYVNQYKNPTQNFLKMIEKLTSKIGEGQIDIIVVGNNLGSGLLKVKAINCMKNEFTIVVHHMSIDEWKYREIGFSNICQTIELGEQLIKLAQIYRDSLE